MRKRILVVEDEPDISRVLGMILDVAGYEVPAADGLAAARKTLAESPPPDLVILDLVLADGDGAELCREVKSAHPSLPVIALTAQVHAGARERALAAGCDHFVAKPFEVETLEALVRLTLGDAPDRRRRARAG